MITLNAPITAVNQVDNAGAQVNHAAEIVEQVDDHHDRQSTVAGNQANHADTRQEDQAPHEGGSNLVEGHDKNKTDDNEEDSEVIERLFPRDEDWPAKGTRFL